GAGAEVRAGQGRRGAAAAGAVSAVRRAGPACRWQHLPPAMGGVAAGDPAGGSPLARLFAIAYRQLIDGLHDRLRAQSWTDVRPAFGFVLLAAREQPTSVTELATLMGMTKQAASKLVDAMVSGGYVRRGADAEDGRQRPVSLTGRGEELLSA